MNNIKEKQPKNKDKEEGKKMRTHLTTLAIILTFILAVVPGTTWGHYPYSYQYDKNTIKEKVAKGEEITAEEYAVLGMHYATFEKWDDALGMLQKGYEKNPNDHHVAYAFSYYYGLVADYYGNPMKETFDAQKAREAEQEAWKWKAKGIELNPEGIPPSEIERVEEWKRTQEGYYENIERNPITDAKAGTSKMLSVARDNYAYLLGIGVIVLFIALVYNKRRYKETPR